MKLSANNFLTVIKNIVTGGGRMADGVTVRNDAGYMHDMNYPVSEMQADSTAATLTDSTAGTPGTTLAAVVGTTYSTDIPAIRNWISSLAAQVNILTALANNQRVASETNLRVFQAAASTTTVGRTNVVIPRDYDEATDTLALHVGVAMAGATDTPGLTATAYRKRPGSNIVTVATAVVGKLRSGATAALSATEQVVIFDFSKNTLLMDDSVTIVITSDAHTTDALLVYYVQPVYRSTLVSYHESTGGTRDGKDGLFIR